MYAFTERIIQQSPVPNLGAVNKNSFLSISPSQSPSGNLQDKNTSLSSPSALYNRYLPESLKLPLRSPDMRVQSPKSDVPSSNPKPESSSPQSPYKLLKEITYKQQTESPLSDTFNAFEDFVAVDRTSGNTSPQSGNKLDGIDETMLKTILQPYNQELVAKSGDTKVTPQNEVFQGAQEEFEFEEMDLDEFIDFYEDDDNVISSTEYEERSESHSGYEMPNNDTLTTPKLNSTPFCKPLKRSESPLSESTALNSDNEPKIALRRSRRLQQCLEVEEEPLIASPRRVCQPQNNVRPAKPAIKKTKNGINVFVDPNNTDINLTLVTKKITFLNSDSRIDQIPLTTVPPEKTNAQQKKSGKNKTIRDYLGKSSVALVIEDYRENEHQDDSEKRGTETPMRIGFYSNRDFINYLQERNIKLEELDESSTSISTSSSRSSSFVDFPLKPVTRLQTRQTRNGKEVSNNSPLAANHTRGHMKVKWAEELEW